MIRKIPGPLSVIIASCCFATGGLLFKLVDWTPLAANAARSFIAIWIMLLYARSVHLKLHINKSIFIGALSLAGTNILHATANKLTTAGNTIILQFTAPIFVLIYEFFIYKRKPKKADVITCFFVFLGVAIFFMDGLSAGHIAGDIIAVVSGMCYAGVFMMNDSKDASPLNSVIFGNLISIAVGLPSLLQMDFAATTAKTYIGIAVLGIFQLGLAYIFFTEGLKTTPPVTASLLAVIEALLNPTLVAIFMDEKLTPLSLVGAAIVLVSITLYNVWKARKQEQEKQEVQHAGR